MTPSNPDPTGVRRLVAAATEAEDACHQIASCGHKAYCNLCHGGGECTCGIQRARDSLRELAAAAAVRVEAIEELLAAARNAEHAAGEVLFDPTLRHNYKDQPAIGYGESTVGGREMLQLHKAYVRLHAALAALDAKETT